MPYWRHFYHLIWATRNREPLIGNEEKEILLRSFDATCEKTGIIPHATGIVSDHVHLVVSIPPSMSVSDALHRLKGASSHAVNTHSHATREGKFAWQGAYGSLTFGERSKPMIVEYVLNQRRHHAENTLLAEFERIDPPVELG